MLTFPLLACSSSIATPIETETTQQDGPRVGAMPESFPHSLQSESPPGTIPSTEAAKYIAKKAKVYGTVVSTRAGSDTAGAKLDFDQPFPDQSFNVKISQQHMKNFPENLQDHHNGKQICVSGYIDSFFSRDAWEWGVPFMNAEKPGDIEEAP